jgi:SAM-dependent methyltransferase
MTMTTTTTPQAERVRAAVREAYGAVAEAATTGEGACCGPGCCSPGTSGPAIGYSDAERASLPEGADLGLGCGNPQAIASLQPGERVLDLGSGAGIDVFLAAQQVGETGRAIGVDMTAAMLAKARANAVKTGLTNVEFRLGEIEHLPMPDASVDVIMSNCVINLSPDKATVFREAFRVLAPGGRLAIADIVALAPLPRTLATDLAAHTACVAGAALVEDLESMLADAGFVDIRIDIRAGSRDLVAGWVPGQAAEDYVASAGIQARKPAAG